jgi:DNA-binding CsgD family transcriptional regulator/N-acetylneuraminic acid mutarotase
MASVREELSEREKEILTLVATGASNKEIAAKLDISASTVKVHLRNIFAKMEVRSRTEATMVAIEMGLVQPPAGSEPRASEPSQEAAPEAGPAIQAVTVLWWQKATMVLALLVAAAAIAWPGRPAARASEVLPDPLREQPAAGVAGAPREEVGRWSEAAQMPTGRHRFAAAAVGSEIVVVGGDSAEGITGSLEVYDSGTNTWRLGTPKPIPVSNVGAATVDGLVYVPGGLTADGQVTRLVEVYDPATDSWRRGPALPEPLCAYAIATDGQNVYIAGGWDGREYRTDTLVLEPGADTWRRLAPLPHPRLHAAAVWAQGRLFVIGGYDGRQVLTRVDVFVPEEGGQGRWEAGPPLVEARAGLGAVAIGDTIYAVGGGWTAATAFCERLAVGQTAWQQWEMPVTGAWRNMAVVADDTTVYAMGGWEGDIRAELYRYQAVYQVMLPITR